MGCSVWILHLSSQNVERQGCLLLMNILSKEGSRGRRTVLDTTRVVDKEKVKLIFFKMYLNICSRSLIWTQCQSLKGFGCLSATKSGDKCLGVSNWIKAVFDISNKRAASMHLLEISWSPVSLSYLSAWNSVRMCLCEGVCACVYRSVRMCTYL